MLEFIFYLYLFIFTGLYIYLYYQVKFPYKYACRVISTIHAFVVVIFAIIGLIQGRFSHPHYHQRIGHYYYYYSDIIKYYSLLIFNISKSYLLLDLVTQFLFDFRKNEFLENIFHHTVMYFSMYYSYKYDYDYYLMIGLLCEISTPFLNICYYCIHEQKTNTTAFKYSSISLLATFFLFRIINFFYLCFFVTIRLRIEVFILMLMLLLLNLHWFLLLLKKSLNSLNTLN
jgi:hypothetical protein